MMVQWVSRDRGLPTVRWGRSLGRYTDSAPGDSTTYSRADMCGPPANASGWADPGWLHAAVMRGLQPGQRYFYRYGDSAAAAGGEEGAAWSGEESFVAPPAAGTAASVTLLAVADLGQAEVDGSMEASEMLPSLATTARLAAEVDAGAQLLVHNGDISCEQDLSVPLLLPNKRCTRFICGVAHPAAPCAIWCWAVPWAPAATAADLSPLVARAPLQMPAALAASGTCSSTSWDRL